MKQTTDELKKIIADAPEDCNYTGDDNSFFLIQGNYIRVWLGRYWSYPVCNPHNILTDLNIRSLSDIKEIIELRERLAMVEQPVKFWVHTADDERN